MVALGCSCVTPFVGTLGSLEPIDWRLIETHCPDMLRVAVSIKAGRVAPSPMEFSGRFGGLGVGVNFSHVIRNAGPRVGRPIHGFDSDCGLPRWKNE
jgi:hypothetical protein